VVATQPTASRRSAAATLLAPALVAAVFWLYAPVRHHGFLDYDDALYVTGRPEVQQGLTAEGAAWAFRNVVVGNWHPLTWLSHMLDVELFGQRAGAHHLVNVGLHAVNAWLLYALLLGATAAPGRSAFAAAAFALHPLRVESVAWIAERKDVLSALCFFLALGAYARLVARPSAGRQALLLGVAALGLLAKSMLVSLPIVLLLLDVWPLRRLTGRAELVARLREKLPLAVLCAAFAGIALFAQAGRGSVAALDVLPLAQRAGNALVAVVAYLGDTLWPSGLAVFYPHPRGGLPLWQPLGSAALLAGLGALCVREARTRPYLWVGLCWMLVMLLPVIGLVQVGAQARADRYTYLPLIGPVVALTWWAADTCAGQRVARLLPAAACAVLAAFTLSSRATLAHWRNDEALFARAATVTRDNAIALLNWAKELDARPQQQRALLERAIALEPRFPAAHYELGRVLADAEDLAGAERHYRLALRGDPYNARAHNNLGNLLLGSGRGEEAVGHYRLALALEPGRASTTHNLFVALRARARILAQEGRQAEAIATLEEAAALAPEDPEIRADLTRALAARDGAQTVPVPSQPAESSP
jgi:Flp pilus assembly protein TadD